MLNQLTKEDDVGLPVVSSDSRRHSDDVDDDGDNTDDADIRDPVLTDTESTTADV